MKFARWREREILKLDVEWCKFRKVYNRKAKDFGDWWEEGTDDCFKLSQT